MATYCADDAVMHFEFAHRRTACGLRLPTRGFSTDDMGIMESREGTRCKRCWRVIERASSRTESTGGAP